MGRGSKKRRRGGRARTGESQGEVRLPRLPMAPPTKQQPTADKDGRRRRREIIREASEET